MTTSGPEGVGEPPKHCEKVQTFMNSPVNFVSEKPIRGKNKISSKSYANRIRSYFP
jgi:hypothetical protein